MVKGNILIVDDDELIRKSMYEVLRLEGYDVGVASNGLEGFEELKRMQYDIVITDLKMPELDGISLLKKIKEHFTGIDVIVVTSFGSIENAVEAMKYGAIDYITKPIIDDEIKLAIRKILKTKQMSEENEFLKKELCTKRVGFQKLIGEDHKMQKIYSLIEMVSNTNATTLVHGESGTGKGMIARALHAHDPLRKDKPFVEVSCGALPGTLLESELFGHTKGAFTSAIKDRKGRFEMADTGTIFLDEIDTISPLLQVKLLRVLQDREFERVGETKTTKVDVRIIAATNQNLQDCINKGTFREDLYYRLNVINVEVPPLRDRKGDIPYLSEHFLAIFSDRFCKKIKGFDRKVFDVFFDYNWPGNVRELENTIERAAVLAQSDLINLGDIPKNIVESKTSMGAVAGMPWNKSLTPLKDALKNPERDIIKDVLEHTNWNRKKTAGILDINRTTLYNKMKEYDLLSK